MSTNRISASTRRRIAGAAAAIAVIATGCSASSETPTSDESGGHDVTSDDLADEATVTAATSDTADAPLPDGDETTPDVADAPVDIAPSDSADPVDTPADPTPADPGGTPADPGSADPGDTPTDPTPSDPADPPVDTPADPADPGDTPADPGEPVDPAGESGLDDLVVEVVDAGILDDLVADVDPTLELVSDIDIDVVALNPCGLGGPIGADYAVSEYVDATGDGTADDVATTYFDTEWRLRLQVAGGWSSTLALGGQLNPWLKVVDGVPLGPSGGEFVVVHEEKVGDEYSFNHFIGVDDDGCLQPAVISLLQGFTGSWYHSLECDAAPYTRYVRTKWHSHDAWELNVTDIRPDGSLALVENTMVGGDHPYVAGRGTNNCD